MEGKTIVKSLELENGYHLLGLDDDTVALVKVVSLSIQKEELLELLGEEDEPEAEATKKEKEKKKSAPVEEETDEAEDDSYTWDDLKEMDFEELKDLVKDNDLDTDPTDFDEDDEAEVIAFRKEIAEEIEIEIPEEDEEDEEDSEPEAEPEAEDDSYTWDDLKEMDFEELEELCDEQNLDTDPTDFDEDENGDEEKLRRHIAKELGITPPKAKKKKK